jgi:hypothetical protein
MRLWRRWVSLREVRSTASGQFGRLFTSTYSTMELKSDLTGFIGRSWAIEEHAKHPKWSALDKMKLGDEKQACSGDVRVLLVRAVLLHLATMLSTSRVSLRGAPAVTWNAADSSAVRRGQKWSPAVNSLIYIIGLVVVVIAVLSFFGLR